MGSIAQRRERMKISCRGETPLIFGLAPAFVMNKVLIQRVKNLELTREDVIAGGSELLACVHPDDKSVGIPYGYLQGCLLEAGAGYRLNSGDLLVESGKDRMTPVLQIEEHFLPFEPKAVWQPDEVAVSAFCRLEGAPTPSAVNQIQAVFDRWGFSATLRVDFSRISESTVLDLIRSAGASKGIGVNRPVSGGQNGKFTLESWAKTN